MARGELTIETLRNPGRLADLAADARSDGSRIVDRLIEEWRDGRNRFDAPGERAYVATLDGRACGVCGLNLDPFAADPSAGRVRRLYVAEDCRRLGIGSALVERLARECGERFTSLRLRTHDPRAAAFYETLGFERVEGDAECTHRRAIDRAGA